MGCRRLPPNKKGFNCCSSTDGFLLAGCLRIQGGLGGKWFVQNSGLCRQLGESLLANISSVRRVLIESFLNGK